MNNQRGLSMDELILIESKSARDSQISTFSDKRAKEIMDRAKALVHFAQVGSQELATNEQMAAYYEVPVETIKGCFRDHREEFMSDGVQAVRGKDLKFAKGIIPLANKVTQAVLWNPRGGLRIGMLLRDSDVAKGVRTTILDQVEQVGSLSQEVEKLRLELEVARAQQGAAIAQKQLMATAQCLETISPGLAPLVLGQPDAIVTKVERVELHTVADERGRTSAQTEGTTKTKIAQSLGMKKAKELNDWLASIGRMDLLETGMRIISCEYVPTENINEIRRLWARREGDRQKLIGEN